MPSFVAMRMSAISVPSPLRTAASRSISIDFDETIRGPFEWDVKRMAARLIIGGLDAGASHGLCHDAAHAFLERYRTVMRSFARMPILEVARYQVHRLRNVQPVSQYFATRRAGHATTQPRGPDHAGESGRAQVQPRHLQTEAAQR